MNNYDKWYFFYDEAFHDRKIDVTKDNKINIYTNDASDIYVGTFIGCKKETLKILYKNFSVFENKFIKKFGLNEELKGTTIKKKNFKYGIRSFNKDTIEFYEDYFDVLDNDLMFNIVMLSKTSYFISEFLKDIKSNIFFNRLSFRYSLIKFLYNYRCMNLLLELFQENKVINSYRINKNLLEILNKVIQKIDGIKKKGRELEALKDIKRILQKSELITYSKRQYLWNYNEVFDGFNLMLQSIDVKQEDVHLHIDREQKTFEAAINNGKYFSIAQDNSKEVAAIRISDILSNFIGRIILAMEENLHEIEINHIDDLNKIDYETKRLLDAEWFNLNERQFIMYKKIYSIFIPLMSKYKWITYGSIFFDYSTLFFCLIQYIGYNESYEQFNQTTPDMHSEYFNQYSCEVLNLRYNEDF
ncbi:hypothetical protein [Clostridium sp. YIM B02555]|uniref:hypothetical protein n=1 Tax=Clostridium sp. YIM B02555 TaxID=2911968 RepID=UPI001EEE2908|nr:hypothetical protein [Clostridium sp. YIM B02555]